MKSVFRRIAATATHRSTTRQTAHYSSSSSSSSNRTRLPIPASPPPTTTASIPSIPLCPAPQTCPCQTTPALPAGYDIDHATPLAGLVPAYAEHVLVCTRRADWPSRIEAAPGSLAQRLKALLGRGGALYDPQYPVSVLNAAFAAGSAGDAGGDADAAVYLLPSFRYVPRIPPGHTDNDDAPLRALAARYLVRTPSCEQHAECPASVPVAHPLVLVCGHAARDVRCGLLGPVLRDQFVATLGEVCGAATPAVSAAPTDPLRATAVGLISHIGGHKFAGNVVVYIPPSMATHPLAGCGVWYGRVEPRHVDGIVRETLRRGNVVRELFRGGLDARRRPLRLEGEHVTAGH